MRKNHSTERGSNVGANQRRFTDRRGSVIRRADDLDRRLSELEDLARANQRELELQFRRIAQIQVDLDSLLKAGRSNPTPPSFSHEQSQSGPESRIDTPLAALPEMHGRRRFVRNPT
jgi:hypothetical protein